MIETRGKSSQHIIIYHQEFNRQFIINSRCKKNKTAWTNILLTSTGSEYQPLHERSCRYFPPRWRLLPPRILLQPRKCHRPSTTRKEQFKQWRKAHALWNIRHHDYRILHPTSWRIQVSRFLLLLRILRETLFWIQVLFLQRFMQVFQGALVLLFLCVMRWNLTKSTSLGSEFHDSAFQG